MNEIENLLQRADKYLQSSELLINAQDYESAVSRTYYAMFFASEAALLAKGLSFSKHKGVISAFGKEFIVEGIFPKEMGRNLRRAYQKRQLGDYQYTFVITKEEAEELLEKGREFLKNIKEYLMKKKKYERIK